MFALNVAAVPLIDAAANEAEGNVIVPLLTVKPLLAVSNPEEVRVEAVNVPNVFVPEKELFALNVAAVPFIQVAATEPVGKLTVPPTSIPPDAVRTLEYIFVPV